VTDPVERNRQAQREAYGEPLVDVFRRLMQAFELSQAGLARVLGISPPMLSQLISAHRVKIGNPAVLHRVRALEELAVQVREGRVPEDEVAAALDGIRASTGQWTRTDAHPGAADDRAVVEAIHGLLRAVASGQELHAAAELLQGEHPELAEILRVYGLGPTPVALDHFARHRRLF
jgi:transcriptional regulator with XRE-family HTH domain